ncbi:hypothetical protein ACFQ1I_35835 [Kitasatospora arboriphila]
MPLHLAGSIARPYIRQFSWPRRCPASWSASATTPEKIGVASLVPPVRCQPTRVGS